MCGVFAAWRRNGGLTSRQVQNALTRLSHRGPDDEGIWLTDDASVALGHRRLSVMGIDNGRQPIANEDGTLHVSVNGEFYEFEAIRHQLEQQGHRFRTKTDSEIVLHLYEEHGVDCLRFLRGEFAFVLWDARTQTLFAARDRFGIKPLVYAAAADGITLASEAKALFAAGVRRAWDLESYFHVSALQYLLPGRTLFQGIRQLPPGHCLTAQQGVITIRPYWDLDFPLLHRCESDTKITRPATNELVEACRGHILDAIHTRLRADVPLCCHLSGGLDSGTVLSVASQTLNRPVDAFVMSFAEEGYDELEHARSTAVACDARLHVVSVSQDELLTHLPEAVVASEGLAINGHLTAKYLLHQRIRKQGFKVVLTGEGADETFAGYAHLRLDQGRFLGDQGTAARVAETNQTSLGMMLPHGLSLPLDGVKKRLGFVPAWLAAKASLGARVQSLMCDDVRAAVRDRDPYGELIDACPSEQLTGRHPVNQATWLWTKTALAGYILKTLGDGTEMASSIEGRVPFLDHHLFEFARDVPVNLKIRGSVEKYVMREAMRPMIPDAIYRREKHPLDAPPLTLFASSTGHETLNDWIRDEAFEQQPFFCRQRCTRLLDALPNWDAHERQVWDPVLMTVLSTLCLQRLVGQSGDRFNSGDIV